jgi:group I intron endonuclease
MEKNIASIYKITNEINGKCYIGFDISYPKRIKQHYNDSKRGVNSPLCNDIRKYGWENFTKELLYQSWDIVHCLKNMENTFIVENESYINGYNRTLGGNGSLGSPRKKSEQWKSKHSKRMLENNPRKGYKFSEKEKQRHSKFMKEYYEKNPDKILFGEKNSMYGKKHSVEWRKKHSLMMKNNKKGVQSMTIKKACGKCGFITTLGNLARYHNDKCVKYLKRD